MESPHSWSCSKVTPWTTGNHLSPVWKLRSCRSPLATPISLRFVLRVFGKTRGTFHTALPPAIRHLQRNLDSIVAVFEPEGLRTVLLSGSLEDGQEEGRWVGMPMW